MHFETADDCIRFAEQHRSYAETSERELAEALRREQTLSTPHAALAVRAHRENANRHRVIEARLRRFAKVFDGPVALT